MKTSFILFAGLVACTCSVSAQWTAVHSFDFYSYPGKVQALNGDSLVVAAGNGLMFFSEDAGQNFSKDSLPFPYSWFIDLDFPSPNVGYVCGGTAFGPVKSPIAKTMDGGKTWDSISGNQFGYQLNAVSFADQNTGYFAGQNLIAKTTDGGQTFSVDTIQQFSWVSDIHFTDVNRGFYMSDRHIYKTADAGQSWNIAFTDTNPNIFPVGGIKFDFVNQQEGFALMQGGDVIKTADGGNTWSYAQNPMDTLRFIDFDFVNASTGYAISLRPQVGGYDGLIFKSTNGGQSWMLQYTDTTQSLRSISMANENVGYVLGDSVLLATQNGGIGLTEEKPALNYDLYLNPASEYFRLELPADSKITGLKLRDVMGRLVKSYPVEAVQFSVNGLKPGVYLVEIAIQGGLVQKYLLVSR